MTERMPEDLPNFWAWEGGWGVGGGGSGGGRKGWYFLFNLAGKLARGGEDEDGGWGTYGGLEASDCGAG